MIINYLQTHSSKELWLFWYIAAQRRDRWVHIVPEMFSFDRLGQKQKVWVTFSCSPEHEGYNVKRLREILHIKQDVLADALGISQQSVSVLESKETIDPETIEKIAKALKGPIEAIKKFDEEAIFNIIANTYNDNSASVHYSFNPVDKIVELYERMIKEKDELIEELKRKAQK